jgi:N-acetyl-alpha-D-muramate 1-phosphate uridylyltransferase
MILAAGRGERMRPLTDHCPKPLLQVADKTLIAYHLEALKQAGIKNVVINVSWLADQIQHALGNGSQFGLSIEYSPEAEALETAGGIVQALDKLDDKFIVVNADVFTDYDYSALLDFKSEAHLVLIPNPAHNAQGDFAIENGLLSNAENNRFTFSGIAAYRKSFFKELQPGKQALAPLLRKAADRQRISAELYAGEWNDIGTPQRLQALNQDMLVR